MGSPKKMILDAEQIEFIEELCSPEGIIFDDAKVLFDAATEWDLHIIFGFYAPKGETIDENDMPDPGFLCFLHSESSGKKIMLGLNTLGLSVGKVPDGIDRNNLIRLINEFDEEYTDLCCARVFGWKNSPWKGKELFTPKK